MEAFSLSLLIVIIASVMLVYFITARAPAEAHDDGKRDARRRARERRREPVIAVDFVRRDAAQQQEHEGIHPVLRQNIVVSRMLQMSRLP